MRFQTCKYFAGDAIAVKAIGRQHPPVALPRTPIIPIGLRVCIPRRPSNTHCRSLGFFGCNKKIENRGKK
jgi:hypothetical protein